MGAFGNSCTHASPPAFVRAVSASERTSSSSWSQKLRRDPQAPGTQLLKRGDNNVEGDRKGREMKERKGKGEEGDVKKGRRRFKKKKKRLRIET